MQDKVYAQVYSMIRSFPEGLVDALHYFSEVGYDGVELVNVNTDGLPLEEFKALLQKLNLKVAAIHGIGSDEDAAFAKELGVKYLTFDVHPKDNTREEIARACEEVNKRAHLLAEQGLKIAIHNHADEFAWVEGEEGKTRVYDLLLEYTDPAVIGFELDTGWAAIAGADVVAYVKEHPGRFPFIHVKECDRLARNEEDLEHFPKRIFNAGVPRDPESGRPILTEEMKADLYETRNWNKALGEGIIDWKTLKEVADAQGCEAYISEREYYHYEGSDGTAACCVKLDYDYLRSL